jgi:hypothetical protein
MHWLLFGIAAIAFGAAFFAPAPGMIGIGMLVGFVSIFVAFFMMIGARIAERSRPDTTMLTDADVNNLRKAVRAAREAKAPGAAAPPGKS